MTSLYLDPHAVISAWEEMGSDSWCDLDACSGATSIALDLSGVEAALKAGSPGTSSPTSWAGEAAAGGAGAGTFGLGSPTSWKAAVAAGGGQGGVTAGRGSGGGAGGLALVPDCPPSDTHTPQVTHPVAAATAAAGSYNTGAPLTWGLRPLSANLLSGPPQQALLLQPLPQGRISSSSGGGAEGGPGAAAGAGGSGIMFSAGGFHIAAAAAGGGVPPGRPLLLRQVSGPSPPPAPAAGTATVVRAGGQLYLLHQQLQYAPAPVKLGTGGQTTAPTASRSTSFEMAVVPDHGRRQGPTCSGQSDSSSPQGGVGGSSHGSGAGWRGHSSSDGADNSPTSTTAAAAADAAGSMAAGRPSCSPAPSSPVSPRGVIHAVTRRRGLVTRRLPVAAAAAALGGSGSAPGLPTAGAAPLGAPPTTTTTTYGPPAADAVTSTPAGHPAGAAGMHEVYARARAECLARYRAKKARRKFTNTVRYHARKVNADKRPRIKGRFVRKEELAAMSWEDLEGGSGDADVDLEMYSQQQQEEAVCYSSYSSRAPPPAAAAAAAAAAVVPVAAPVAAAPPPPAAAAPAAAAAVSPMQVQAQQEQEEDLVGDLLFQDMDMADLDLLDDMTPGLVSDFLYYC